jgi:hypothetical protein
MFGRVPDMRERWWWNGKWGRLARRDVEIHREDGALFVVARAGGAEGREQRHPAAATRRTRYASPTH